MSPRQQALNQYKQTRVAGSVTYADPHALIMMLLTGLQERLAIARGAIDRHEWGVKGEAIGNAMDIINYLQACLDREKGGQIAENLDALYDYMIRCLLAASTENDISKLEEVSGLVREIETAWTAIRDVAVNESDAGPERSAV